MHNNTVLDQMKEVIAGVFEMAPADLDVSASFLEMGLDSISIIQVKQMVKAKFGLDVPVNVLFGEASSLESLAEYVSKRAPSATEVKKAPAPVVKQEFQWTGTASFDEGQRKNLERFIAAFNQKTAGSKKQVQETRKHFANNRNSANYNKALKELAYPLIMKEAKGAYLKDIDGNDYLDMSMGFGVFLNGYNHPVVEKAVREQAGNFFLGPMSALPGEVAALINELTGADRAAFYNSGTEAVMVALRLARAATGRKKIVFFAGSYHGTYDGVLAQRDKFSGGWNAVPKGAGVPEGMLEDVLLLDYGTPEALQIIRQHAHELAAVLVEPVQSRRPEFQPVEFLRELRTITEQQGVTLIFDEIISGFRIHPGGCQHWFDVKADLVTYGKIVGGGLPLGIVAGKAAFMHGVDGGGDWKFGDDSHPVFDHRKVFVAGTFCHHPLAMAAAKAMLLYLKEQGPALQETLNARTAKMADTLNEFFGKTGLPILIVHFGSLFQIRSALDLSLFYHYLAYKGIYVWEGMTLFLSTAHTDADVERFITTVKEVVREMQKNGFLQGASPAEPIALTPEQQRLWFQATAHVSSNIAFNAHRSFNVEGGVNVEALKKAIDRLAARHEILQAARTDGKFFYIGDGDGFEIEMIDAAEEAEFGRRPFDLSNGRLFRVALIGTDKVLLTIHSLIADGWSLQVLTRELTELYMNGEEAKLAAAPSFRVFSDWLARQQESPEAEEAFRFFKERLSGGGAMATLPAIRKVRAEGSNGLVLVLSNAHTRQLKEFAQRQGVSLFMLMLGLFENFLYRLSGQQRVVIGIPAAGQLLMNEPGIVGQCNLLTPYVHTVDERSDAATFLADVKRDWLSFYKYQRWSCFDLLRQHGEETLYPSVKVVFNMDPAVKNDGAERVVDDEVIVKPGENKYDLFLNVVEAGSLRLHFQFDRQLYPEAIVREWIANFQTMMYGIVANPKVVLRELDMEAAEPVVSLTVPALLREQPDKPVFVCNDVVYTYKDIDKISGGVAVRLAERGVGRGKTVLIGTTGVFETVFGVLAAMRLGAAWYWPDGDIRPGSVIVSDVDVREQEGSQILEVDENSVARIYNDTLSYTHQQLVGYLRAIGEKMAGEDVLIVTEGLDNWLDLVLAGWLAGKRVTVKALYSPAGVSPVYLSIDYLSRLETERPELPVAGNWVLSAGLGWPLLTAQPLPERTIRKEGWNGHKLSVADETGRPLPAGAEGLLYCSFDGRAAVKTGVRVASLGKQGIVLVEEEDVVESTYFNSEDPVTAAVVGFFQKLFPTAPITDRSSFFALGGSSIQGMQLITWIYREWGLQLDMARLFECPEVGQIAGLIRKDGYGHYQSIPRLAEAEDYEASHAQRRLWILDQNDSESLAYNMSSAYVFTGAFNREAYTAALTAVINRHESLRTTFINKEGEIRQKVHAPGQLPVKVEFESLVGRPDAERAAEEIAVRERNTPFDLEAGPLVRARLLEMDDQRHVLIFTLHHIISDGWSKEIITEEVVSLYHAYDQGKTIMLPELAVQYKDFTHWQNAQVKLESNSAARQYWLDRFSGDIPVLDMPADHSRPSVRTQNGANASILIGGELLKRINGIANSKGCTLFTFFFAAVKVLLYKHSGQNDLIVGLPTSGRDHPDTEKVVGLFVHTLPIRTSFDVRDHFSGFLQQVKQNMMDAYRHQVYPVDKLIEELNVSWEISRRPLFDVMINWLDMHEAAAVDGQGDLAADSYAVARNNSMFDLAFAFASMPGGTMELNINYNTDIYKADRIQRMLKQFVVLLENIVAAPETSLHDLRYLPQEEEQRLLAFAGEGRALLPADNLVQLFEGVVAEHGDEIAVCYGDVRLSYAEVNIRANRLASRLLDQYGLRRGARVGLLFDRNENMLVGVLGVMKALGVYVPIDKAYTSDRVDYILQDSGVEVLVTEGEYASALPVVRIEDVSGAAAGNPGLVPDADDLVYLMYTSGSTGRPKGVKISHRQLLSLWTSLGEAYKLAEMPVRLLQVASFSFDVFFEDLLRSIFRGGRLVICPDAARYDMAALSELIRKESITIVESTPGLLVPLMDHLSEEGNGAGSLRIVISGSDALRVDDYRRIRQRFEGLRFVNSYGTTETCIDASCYDGQGSELRPVGYVPIGRPLSNTRMYVLDAGLRLSGIGVRGEICIGGQGVGEGYWMRPELTAERFVEDPFVTGGRLYRTGDQGRWTSQGMLEYVGRGDHQVKIRGYRVEPGEVESAIQGYGRVKEAVVLAQEMGKGDRQLVGYVVWAGTADVEGLREHCRRQLPVYMQPAHYVTMEEIPLTANGKVDRKLLPKIEVKATAAYEGARNEAEEVLVGIWEEVLERTGIGIWDNFFDLGGHSLKGIKVIWRIRKELGIPITFPDIFTYPRIADLGTLIHQRKEAVSSTVALTEISSRPRYELSHGQLRMWIIGQMEESRSAYNMCSSFELRDVVDKDALQKAFERLIDRHEILRTVFVSDHEGVWQQVLTVETCGFQVSMADITGLSLEEQQGRLARLSAEEVQFRFDLGRGPLLRAHLLKMRDDFSVLLINMHHIISDGWSIDVMLEELTTLYEGYQTGQPVVLEPLRIQYKEYASWQNRLLNSSDIEPHRNYWLDHFKGEIPVLNLPTDFTRPAVRQYKGATVKTKLSKEDTRTLQQSVQREPDKSMFMVLLGCLYSLLYRYTGQEDIVLGILVAGRDHDDLLGQIGLYVNTLALRAKFEGNKDFSSLLDTVQESVLGAFENQVYPFDLLVEDLDLAGDRSRSPLFDVLVTYKKEEWDESMEAAPSSEEKDIDMNDISREDSNIAKFDMTITFREQGDQLYMSINYRTDLFTETRAGQMLGHLSQLIASVGRDRSARLSDIPYLTPAENKLLLGSYTDTRASYPVDKTIPALVEDQVDRDGATIAVRYEDRALSYDELNKMANRLAHYLIQQFDLGAGKVAGVLMERSERMVVTLLAILKTGAAYVPVDVDYPADRIRYILGDSQPVILLSDVQLSSEGWPAMERINMRTIWDELDSVFDYNPAVDIRPADLAYLIYTSGSTGRPKGVKLTHRNAVAFIAWCWSEFGGEDFQTVLALTSYCFDLSIFEMFYSLSAGKTIQVLRSVVDAKKYIESLPRLLLNTVPSVVDSLIKLDTDFANVRLINVAGEPVPASLKAHFKGSGVAVRNLYGPSEDTTYSTCYVFNDNDDAILIGKPIHNTRIYILDENRQLVPPGWPGEICISGVGLAQGYLGMEELTASKFVPNPYEKGERLYRTGDLGQWTPDGNILFLGRNDDQVKIRGYRIELGEIQHVLLQHPAVKQAVVIAFPLPTGERDLAAYIVWRDTADEAGLQAHLRQRLPIYMQPASWITLDKLPLNSNGKIDKKALPVPTVTVVTAAPVVEKKTEMEEKIIAIWEEVLQRKGIGLTDNFFEIGGHSLKGMRVLARLNATFNVKFTLKDIFKKPTVRLMAEAIAEFAAAPVEKKTEHKKMQEIII